MTATEMQIEERIASRGRVRAFAGLFLGPCVFYFVAWCVLTWPLVARFSTHFFSDAEDGLAFAWIFWWFDKSIIDLHQSPLYTTWLHYPYGILMLSHPPMFFNNAINLALQRVLPLEQTYNILYVLCFVLSGWSAFLLCRRVTGHYLASLAGGWLFTFSAFHFSHATGHMNLSTMEWIPLFVLAWWAFLERPEWKRALAAAGCLFLVMASDTYYFVYCSLAGAAMFAWVVWSRRDAFVAVLKGYALPLGVFFVAVLATSGPFIGALVISNMRDPLNAPHDPSLFSLDLVAPFVYSFQWRFGDLTRGVWSQYVTNQAEGSVHLGLAAIAAISAAALLGRRLKAAGLGMWFVLLVFFFLLAMGPRLQVLGHVTPIIMPYALLEKVLPPLKLAGTPVRMSVMVYLAGAVLFSAVLAWLLRKTGVWKWAAAGLFALMVVEQLPRTPPATQLQVPGHVKLLRDLPGREAIIDIGASMEFLMLYPKDVPMHAHKHALANQMIHERPMALGFAARVSEGTKKKNVDLIIRIHEGKYRELRDEYGFRYLVMPAWARRLVPQPSVEPIYADPQTALYDLKDVK